MKHDSCRKYIYKRNRQIKPFLTAGSTAADPKEAFVFAMTWEKKSIVRQGASLSQVQSFTRRIHTLMKKKLNSAFDF